MPLPADFWVERLARFCGRLQPPDWLASDPPTWEWPAIWGLESPIEISVHHGVVDESLVVGPADEMDWADGLGVAARRVDQGFNFGDSYPAPRCLVSTPVLMRALTFHPPAEGQGQR